MDRTDWQLIRMFADDHSQAAFSELTRRYTNLVYRVCQRELSDHALAEDAAQAVFLLLAQKAPSLRPTRTDATLSPWLFQTALLTARNVRRSEQRRTAREQEATQMQENSFNAPERWADIEPLLNDALHALPPGQRTLILARYFEDRPLAEIGAGLGISEDAARMRVNRALDRLRRFFAARNIALSAAALAALLPHAVQPAPAQAAALLARLPLPTSGGSSALTPVQTIAQGAIHTMNIQRLRLQLGAAAVVAVFVLGTAGAVRVTSERKAQAVRAEQQQGSAQAVAIMNQMYATYAVMHSFKCHDSIRQERIGATSSADYEIERPDKVRFHRISTFTPGLPAQPDSVDVSGQSLTVCDGSNIYQTSTESHWIADRYVKMPFSQSSLGLQFFGNWGGLPGNGGDAFAGMPSVAVGSKLRPLVDLNNPIYSMGQPAKIDVSGSGHPITLDVVIARMSYRVGTRGADFPGACDTVTYFIGRQDHLLYQVIVTDFLTSTDFNTMTETISNMEINPRIDPADFVFTPPPGSHAVGNVGDLFPGGRG